MRQTAQVTQPAPDGTVFGPETFSAQVGHRIPLRIPGSGERTCELAAAEVSADGSEAVLTFRLPDDIRFPVGPVSII